MRFSLVRGLTCLLGYFPHGRSMQNFLTNASISILLTQMALAQAPQGASSQTQPAASQTPAANAPQATAPAPLPTPVIVGPLQAGSPHSIEGGPFGTLALNGILSGLGLWQGNPNPSDNSTQATLSNGQVFLQRTEGWFQFYLQGGAYNIPELGVPFLGTGETSSTLYGPLPVGFLKLQPAKNTSFLAGQLPTLIGAEYAFTFQDMNIERGLLWNQENAVNRGIQVNQSWGKLTASLSWNDGFYSDRFTWLSGALTYANGPHSLEFVGGGNYGQTAFRTLATPVQNNSRIYDFIYTYTKGPWIVQPYFQHTVVPTNPQAGVDKGASTDGGAILVNRTFRHGFSLPVRWEYIASSGNAAEGSVNLLYGPGSSATSITLTPTFQYQRFFARGDFAWVHAIDITPGLAFGPAGANQNQPRVVGEIGFIF
jgi:hypothetical protein